MRRSQIDNQTWSFHTNGSANPSNQWPELCQKSEVKHSARKKESISVRQDSRVETLDNSEYPELSVALKSRPSKELCSSKPSVQIIVPMQSDMEPKRTKSLKRYKRSDRICINLQEALQSTRCVNKANKEAPKLKISLYKGSLGITVPNRLDRTKNSDLRKVKICISKDKKPSKLKKIILLNRNMKGQTNIERRETFECKKMEAICRDVDAINFNALKITADPQIDLDYVRSMCTMSLYDKDYRSVNEVNVSDDTVTHRPDVIERINNLKIQERQLTNRIIGSSNRAQFSHFDSNAVTNEIVNQTLMLRIKEDVKDVEELKDKGCVRFSHNFREYCTNMLTRSLNESLEKFLQEIARLQKRFHEKNPNKSKYKRRYYSGLKEVRKHAELRKLKFVIVAPDIEKVELDDGLDDQVAKLLETCRKQNVVFGFGLRRRKLGYFTHGKGLVGCIGIANYSGTEQYFENVLMELVHARNAFKKLNGAVESIIDISKVVSDDYLLSENIGALLKVLSRAIHS